MTQPRVNQRAEDENAPTIGVVIPTFNRREHLLIALDHLERQTTGDFEVVIVDDGSTDDTAAAIERYLPSAPFPLRYFRQANSGPARARNFAASVLRAPVCLMIGDDIFASPGFVEAHARFHRQNTEPQAAAVGLTRWCEQRQVVTPLMRWLERDGVQFAYGELLSGTPASWKHFYTSNLSMKTAYLRQHCFSEGFRSAGMEDIELGYRLAQKHGLRMHFLVDAHADHLHPTDFAKTCNRAIASGTAMYAFGELWPERRLLPSKNPLKRWLVPLLAEPRWIMPAMRLAADSLGRVWCPNPLMLPTLLVYERFGYWSEESRQRALSRGQAAHQPLG